jgi:hypothetical protein
MMMANLRGRLRSWFHRHRHGSAGAIPTTPQPIDVSRTMEQAQPPPIPSGELPQLESDVLVIEAEDADVRAWADAFAAYTSGGRKS